MFPIVNILKRGPEIGFPERTVLIVIAVGIFSTVFEAAALLIFVPVYQLIQANGDTAKLIAEQAAWQKMAMVSNFVGIPLTVPVLLAISFTSFLARQLVTYAAQILLADTRHTLGAKLRQELFGLALHADLSALDKRSVGSQVNTIAGEIDRATNGLLEASSFVSRALMGLGYAVLLLWVSPQFTLAAVATFGATGFALRKLLSQSRKIGERIVLGYQTVTDFLIARLRAVRLIRLSNTEQAEMAALRRIVFEQRDNLLAFERLRARLGIVNEPIVVGVSFLVVAIGYSWFGLRLEEIGLFLVIMVRLLPIAGDLLRSTQTVLGVLPSFDVLAEMRNAFAEARERCDGTRPLQGVDCDITFDDVTYTYEGQTTPALRGIDLHIPANSVSALVGPSGAGKSTLIDLLPALRRPQSGTVRVGGIALDELSIPDLRRAIGYLPQAPQLFNVTVAEHIRYGNPEADMAEVERAARLAGAHDFIMSMPDGYASFLGDGGSRLSGGQRQRIDLARALVARPRILILDEPTSQLDADTERLFKQTLKAIQHERQITVLVVGHRLSTVRDADCIFVLQGGTVAEQGTHQELLARNGWYAAAVRKQTADTDLIDSD